MKIVICGMKSEADIARKCFPIEDIILLMGDRDKIKTGLNTLFYHLTIEKIEQVISFGLCAGLNPSLVSGDLAMTVYGCKSILSTPTDKKITFQMCWLDGYDQETDLASLFAVKIQRPLKIIRVVLDTAQDTLPPSACIPLVNGSPNPWAIAWSVFCNPLQIPQLIKLAFKQKIALRALLKAGQENGRLFPNP